MPLAYISEIINCTNRLHPYTLPVSCQLSPSSSTFNVYQYLLTAFYAQSMVSSTCYVLSLRPSLLHDGFTQPQSHSCIFFLIFHFHSNMHIPMPISASKITAFEVLLPNVTFFWIANTFLSSFIFIRSLPLVYHALLQNDCIEVLLDSKKGASSCCYLLSQLIFEVFLCMQHSQSCIQ